MVVQCGTSGGVDPHADHATDQDVSGKASSACSADFGAYFERATVVAWVFGIRGEFGFSIYGDRAWRFAAMTE